METEPFFWLNLGLGLWVDLGCSGLLEHQDYFIVTNGDALHQLVLSSSEAFEIDLSLSLGVVACEAFREGEIWVEKVRH